MEEIIKIGYNRLPVLIGVDGSVKKEISKKTNTNIEIDSNTGEVIISTDGDFLNAHIAQNVVLAIARGFSPEKAFKLFNDDYVLEVIPLDDYVKKSNSRHTQIKGRVIGREGRIKKMIEQNLHCFLSIYGKTVSIISKDDDLAEIRNLIEKLLSGAKHTVVFKALKSYKFKNEGYKPVKKTNEIDDISFD